MGAQLVRSRRLRHGRIDQPRRVTGFGTDHKTDIGFDAQYQFLADHDSVSVQASWITENQS